jgi:ABC-type antimicrobial peptide transport system permease subunit
MLKNYFTTAYRNLIRKRASTFFNVAGLTLGIAGSIVLFLLITRILSFDKFQTNYERIYRVVTEEGTGEDMFHTPGVPTVLPVAFRNDFEEAEQVVITSYEGDGIVLIPQKDGEPQKFQEDDGIVFTEQSFFNIFDRTVLHGEINTALDEPNEVVISKKLAEKYFGKEDARGEILNFRDQDYKVSAIIDDTKTNTDFPFTLLLSYETVRKQYEEQGWGSTSSGNQCYFLLKEGIDISKLEGRMQAFTDKYIGEDNYSKRIFNLQPLRELHFDTRYYGYGGNTVSRANILALAFIAIFLVLTGCINFVNLSTAESIKRSKEVGIRKTLGGTRNQLLAQFLGETGIVTFVSILLAIVLAQGVLLYLNPYMELDLVLALPGNLSLLSFLVILFFVVSLLSGIYPAFIMAGFSPAMVMKNKTSNKNSTGFFMRKGLVVFQFFISQLLIVGTIVIISQMNYFKSKDLGFDKEAIIRIPIPEQERVQNPTGETSKMRTLKNEILRIAGVEMASLCNTPPSSGSVSGTGFILEGESEEQRKDTQIKTIDGDYVKLFNLKLIAGKNLTDLDTATGYIVNREFAKVAGFLNPEEMIGKRIRIWGRMYPVEGVVENFHTTSLHQKIEPTAMFNRLSNYRTLAVKVNQQSFQTNLPSIKQLWEAAYPKHIFDYSFLDKDIQAFYDSEEKMSMLLSIFTSVAILIGCIGLFGLATFMANQKTKEIGVRKVLGASVNGIIFSFSKEYIILVFVSFLLAAPLAWYVMSAWLNEFSYKITLGPVVFLVGLASTLIIAVLTVGYKSFQSATANPVDALRSE